MESIEHKLVSVNGITMHVAEKGRGSNTILFLHGFPDLWYTWHRQILAFAALGYRTVAPDLRGYGDTDAPESVTSYTCHHIVGDIVALIQTLGVDKVYVVAHDWGAMIGWYLCLFRPDMVTAFVSLTVPFRPRNPRFKPVEGMRAFFGNDYYMCRFQEPEMEAEIRKYGTANYIKKVVADRKPGPPCLAKRNPFGNPTNEVAFPSWFSEEDLKYYVNKFENKGFSGPLNYYRTLDLSWELMAPWAGSKVNVPVKFIAGDEDVIYTTPGSKEYIHGPSFKKDVPLLEDIVIMEGVAHFLHQERPEEVNAYIYDFIRKF